MAKMLDRVCTVFTLQATAPEQNSQATLNAQSRKTRGRSCWPGGQRAKSLLMAWRPLPSSPRHRPTHPRQAEGHPLKLEAEGRRSGGGLKNVSMQQHKEASDAWSSETVRPCTALRRELTCCWPTAQNYLPWSFSARTLDREKCLPKGYSLKQEGWFQQMNWGA